MIFLYGTLPQGTFLLQWAASKVGIRVKVKTSPHCHSFLETLIDISETAQPKANSGEVFRQHVYFPIPALPWSQKA